MQRDEYMWLSGDIYLLGTQYNGKESKMPDIILWTISSNLIFDALDFR